MKKIIHSIALNAKLIAEHDRKGMLLPVCCLAIISNIYYYSFGNVR